MEDQEFDLAPISAERTTATVIDHQGLVVTRPVRPRRLRYPTAVGYSQVSVLHTATMCPPSGRHWYTAVQGPALDHVESFSVSPDLATSATILTLLFARDARMTVLRHPVSQRLAFTVMIALNIVLLKISPKYDFQSWGDRPHDYS